MSRVFRTLAFLALFGSSVAAQDENPWYVSLGAGFTGVVDSDGPTGQDISFDEGYSLNLGIGRTIWRREGFRGGLHGEVLLNNFDVDEDDAAALSLSSEKTESVSFFLNATGDWSLAPQFGIYGAIGVGFAANITADGFDQPGPFTLQDDSVFAWQAKAGFKYGLGNGPDLNLGYRFVSFDGAEITSLTSESFDLELDQHIFEVVLNWGI